MPDITVLIATYNRAPLLMRTLDSLARLRSTRTWEVLVVDNNSTDETPRVVAKRAGNYPVVLRYVFERQQGKSVALNTGIARSTGRVIAFTDDDVDVTPEWLEASVQPLFARTDIDYTGGPVRPMWEAPKPAWLDERGNLGGTIAVKDHGDTAFVFEERRRTPLGVNMTVRRSLIERIGGFRPDLGRRGSSLLGQEQAEFFCRSRQIGARGLYVPQAVLYHFVPAARLTRSYYRRWWYWKGISHSRLHRIHPTTELGVDLRSAPHVMNVPRYMYGDALRDVCRWFAALVRRDRMARTERAMMVAYFCGYWRDRQRRDTRQLGSPTAQVGSRASQPS